MIRCRCGTLMDLKSLPSLPLWKCFGYFVLVAFGVELLVSDCCDVIIIDDSYNNSKYINTKDSFYV